MSETRVKEGYSLVIVGPDGSPIWKRSLSGSSFEEHDDMFYLGEQVVEALPEDAFEPYKEEEPSVQAYGVSVEEASRGR